MKRSLRIDNGDFCVFSLVFTFLLISARLYGISNVITHQMNAEILSYRMMTMV